MAFNTLKFTFTTAPVLSHWIPNAPQIIKTDVSDYAIAVIHSIRLPDGELHPVAFHSRTLGPAERNYDTHDKELLAIHEAFKIWRHHLEGSPDPIEVFTDHKNLEYFTSTKTLTRRQARWSVFLNVFNLSLCFRPGKLGAKPDALTRRWDVYPKGGEVTMQMRIQKTFVHYSTQTQFRCPARPLQPPQNTTHQFPLFEHTITSFPTFLPPC